MGTHGYARDKQSNYIDKDKNRVIKISAPFDGNTSKNFGSYEYYDSEYAASKTALDTIFYN